ncbi:hypothetical protein [Peribacillus simplex]|uniref:hypothetical protein n=1 Tax=Peribacillus TaxID=2675229 RepID=UPI0036DA60F1
MSKDKKIKLKKPKKWWGWVLAIIVIANLASGWDQEEVVKEEKEDAPKQSLLLQGFSRVSQYVNFLFFHTSIVIKI